MRLITFVYFLLNILSTYLVTTSFNKNIVRFNTNVVDEFSSLLGNFAILLIILMIGLFIFKKERKLFLYLVIMTLILNVFLLLVGYFTRSFKAFPSLLSLTLFRNPNAGFHSEIILDGLTEIIYSLQILCLVPFVLMVILFLVIRVDESINKNYIRNTSLLLIGLLSSFSSTIYFLYNVSEWPFRSERPLYGVLTSGIYNYYLSEVVYQIEFNSISENSLDEYNRDTSNSGILEGMNLFVIQAESLQNFVLDFPYITPNLNEFIRNDNVFYFSNLYSVVGLGNTSDAEMAFNTGYYPLGDLTINWVFEDNYFEINSLPIMFQDYKSYAYNPTVEGFYAHKNVFENLYKYNRFVGLETFNEVYPFNDNEEFYYHDKWVSDKAILQLALQNAKREYQNGFNHYSFIQTISPHYPFVSLYLDGSLNLPSNLDIRMKNYLDQINHIDSVLYNFLMKAKDELPNTVFIIYGDHSNTLSKKEYEILYQRELSEIEYRKILLEVATLVYDPSGKINEYLSLNNFDKKILTSRVLSQIDLYSTVVSMYNLSSTHLLGVDIFSYEQSFSIDPKALDIITDSFFYSLKNHEYEIYDDTSYEEMIAEVNRLKEFKLANDYYLTELISS